MNEPPGLTRPPIDNTTFVADAAHHLPGRMGEPVRLILLHNTESRNGLRNAPSGAWLSTASPGGESAHHLYGRDGTRYDLVHRVDTAYHAGVSAWQGYRGVKRQGETVVGLLNLISIGHELESTSRAGVLGNGYSPEQMNSLAYTVACEMLTYRIGWEAVAYHRDVALPPGRRADPSYFDTAEFRHQTDAWLTFLRSLPPEQQAVWMI